jgi:undecaprenol kinase/diacylglycerol kinase (ATP)
MEGIAYAFRSQANMRIHGSVAILVVAAGLFLGLSALEWALILLTIGFVISAEMINSVAELAVDLLTRRQHPMAKAAKDVGAGAVLVAALAAVAVGVCIFGPRIWALVFG